MSTSQKSQWRVARKWVIGAAVVLIAALMLVSCNTMRGAREDVRRGADGVVNMFR